MRTIHVYHGDPKGAAAIAEALRTHGIEAVTWSDPDALRGAIGEMEILIAERPPRDALGLGRRLVLLHRLGAGVDDLLPAPGLPESTAICAARGVMAPEVSEHAIALVLSLERGLPTLFENQRNREWRMFPMGKLEGKSLGLVGLGIIGARIARIASAMGMRVFGTSKRLRPVEGVEVVPLAALSVDHLVVITPRTPETLGLIDAEVLSRLPTGAYVTSLGRGGVVDEQALLAALREGHIGGAALDVFVDEPLPKDSPWWTAPNTIVTPHVSGYGRYYLERVIVVVVENLRRLAAGEPLLHRVDRALGY